MQFNQFIWNNFKETEKGKSLIEYFSRYSINIKNKSALNTYKSIIQNISYEKNEMDEEYLGKYFDSILLESDWLSRNLTEVARIKTDVSSFEEFENIFDEIIHWVDETDIKNPMPAFSVDTIPLLSECLYFLYPDYCFPYYFEGLYHSIENIFAEFGIFAPPVPKKNDEYKRMLHYVELCRSAYDFRNKFGMDKYEFPAFLYGFAVEVAKKYEMTDVLPEPRKAFFIGGGKKAENVDASDDFAYLDDVDGTAIARWNGNPETQPGDIIVMYCLSPRSYIHSIWRAVTPGFLDPFFYFYKSVYIGQPILVAPISLNEMKNDEILAQMPLVKANMQGINGRVIEKKYFDRILALIEEKGMTLGKIPQLASEFVSDVELKNEKDVEQNLLEPLLKKLGYKEADWKRQFNLRMGRGSTVYPDYVIFPNEERNKESGYWIWEAKYTITTNKQLVNDFGQAMSYAHRLNCKGLGLISKEGIWLSKSPFDFEKTKYWSYKQVNEIDCLNEIFDIAGNKKSFKKFR